MEWGCIRKFEVTWMRTFCFQLVWKRHRKVVRDRKKDQFVFESVLPLMIRGAYTRGVRYKTVKPVYTKVPMTKWNGQLVERTWRKKRKKINANKDREKTNQCIGMRHRRLRSRRQGNNVCKSRVVAITVTVPVPRSKNGHRINWVVRSPERK